MATTIVTGIWNIKRDELSEGWSRTYQHYLDNLEKLMKVSDNMIIYIEEKYRNFVEERRKKENTMIIVRELGWFKDNNVIYNNIQKIRINPEWYNQSGWLVDSTQAKLEMYNPIVMSKMFLLNDARIFDKFDSQFLFWIDAGLTNTVHQGYFTHDKVLDKLPKYINKFSFVCFPYEANNEIHGFKFSEINNIAGTKVELVGRGGFFGGPKNTIGDINSIYYNILQSTLSQNLMGTEESIFSIMVYKHADMVDYFEIESNGLFGKFFEDLKNDSLVRKNKENLLSPSDDLDVNNVALYVITFNSPKQFETLIDIKGQYKINSDYIIAFGSPSSHKNIIGLLYAFSKLKINKNISLVLVPIDALVHPLCVFPDDIDGESITFYVVLPKRNWSRYFGDRIQIK